MQRLKKKYIDYNPSIFKTHCFSSSGSWVEYEKYIMQEISIAITNLLVRCASKRVAARLHHLHCLKEERTLVWWRQEK